MNINPSYCLRYWNPFQHLAVDEGMIPFKGRYVGRQHIRGKPHATGKTKKFILFSSSNYIWSLQA
jgi:hypothetical protein